jgi:gamma-glutamyl-gamma-aminobutyrate hydrolase PuuD
MLCALAGGFLIQHVNNHSGYHPVVTEDGYEFTVNSIHHQMMYPFDVEHEILAKTQKNLSAVHYDEDNKIVMPFEPEYVYFPTVKGFAVQWHPEMMDDDSPATQYVLDTIEQRL